jgi:hypothetical protein
MHSKVAPIQLQLTISLAVNARILSCKLDVRMSVLVMDSAVVPYCNRVLTPHDWFELAFVLDALPLVPDTTRDLHVTILCCYHATNPKPR